MIEINAFAEEEAMTDALEKLMLPKSLQICGEGRHCVKEAKCVWFPLICTRSVAVFIAKTPTFQ